MYQKSRLSTRICVVIVICMLTLSSGTFVFAQGSTGSIGGYAPNSVLQSNSLLAPVAGGPSFYVLSPVDFFPIMWGQGRAFSGTQLINSSGDHVDYIATVHLPDGATVSKMVVYYFDNADPSLDITFELLGCTLPSGSCQSLIYGETAHAVPDYRIGEFLPDGGIVVDLQSMYYLVRVGIAEDLALGVTGVRIDYGYPVSLPVIMR